MPYQGIHSVTVPGTVDGWTKLQNDLNSPLKHPLAPTIHYAEEGFPVAEQVSALWAGEEKLLKSEPATAEPI